MRLAFFLLDLLGSIQHSLNELVGNILLFVLLALAFRVLCA